MEIWTRHSSYDLRSGSRECCWKFDSLFDEHRHATGPAEGEVYLAITSTSENVFTKCTNAGEVTGPRGTGMNLPNWLVSGGQACLRHEAHGLGEEI